MAPTIGFTALLLIISLNFFLPIFEFIAKKDLFLKKSQLNEIALSITALTFLLCLAAQACLIYSYIISDYSVLNVYQNSHHLKPLIYKISGAWGNHEGSMLLLLTVIAGYTFLFALFDKSEFKITTISSQALIILGLTSYTAFASNPFERIFPAANAGLGLNPLLQDIGLAMHPPMLYIGYIGFSLVFSLAIAAMLQEKVTKDLANAMRPWLLLSWGFLSLGIMLGSWWAYRELGWGGFWFWDPVENVSLMPWLASTALLHCIMLLKKQEIFKIWTTLLSIINFILCLLGIFLVRSGLLTSVHSFAVDARRGFFIIMLITIIGGVGLLIFALKAGKINAQKIHFGFFSRISMILLNNYFLVIALFTVVLGTLYPIFAQNFLNSAISVGASYYNKIFAILLAPFLIFLLMSYFLHYDQSALLPRKSILKSFTKFKPSNIAHYGFFLVIAGILLSSIFGITKEVNIKQSETVEISDYKLRFDKIEYAAGKNFVERIAVFAVIKNDEEIAQLKPALRFYPISDQTTNEASILHTLGGDLYLAIGNKDENENYALRIYYKPFIYLIWLGALLMFGAALYKIYKLLQK